MGLEKVRIANEVNLSASDMVMLACLAYASPVKIPVPRKPVLPQQDSVISATEPSSPEMDLYTRKIDR